MKENIYLEQLFLSRINNGFLGISVDGHGQSTLCSKLHVWRSPLNSRPCVHVCCLAAPLKQRINWIQLPSYGRSTKYLLVGHLKHTLLDDSHNLVLGLKLYDQEQSWVFGWPLVHLKNSLQLLKSGISSPSAWPVQMFVSGLVTFWPCTATMQKTAKTNNNPGVGFFFY